MELIHYIFILVKILVGISSVFSENIKAEFTLAKLPTPRYGVQPVYDGSDSIYLIGGKLTWEGYNDYTSEILRYDIALDSIEKIGRMPEASREGAAEWIEAESSF